ncbi:iron-siderophore ABC transporter substrate-binding protein [Sporosarcina sp. E16_8]|uniref:iron-siderophore ABC transporter substrate-binding protein n=1 Tax=Sporosarcina sp. E16_8 TaxID=2789295 RepID=UPI001A935C91|nr:iron-siderophore ABC transporter substrate-binding protein [Sporosarcina sp. E16_8]MBO0589345.1 iron-siderophore ABC transporter substrate-binding protein [Sporosarcina sp. E16_8]
MYKINSDRSSSSRLSVILSLLLLLILLSGCTSPKEDNSVDSIKEAASANTAQQRVIEHAAGLTTIVGKPEKIVVLDYRLADQMLALGIKPYASTTYIGSLELPYLDNDALSGVIPLGDSVNLEALVEIEPDLIISRDSKINDDLSKIAPTVILENSDDWRASLIKMGVVLQKEEEAQQWIEQYEQKLDDARKLIAAHVKPGETFMYLRIQPKIIRLYGPNHGFAEILFSGLKLTPAPGIESIDKAEQISLESLPSFNPDHLFLEVGNSEEDLEAQTDLEMYAATSVWKNLTAVKAGQVYSVPHWTISDYPLIKENSLNLIVNELTSVE